MRRLTVIVVIVPLLLCACQGRDRAGLTAREASAILGVSSCTLVRRTVDPTPGQRLSVEIPIDGRQFRIDLAPHSVRADGYRVLVVGEGRASTDRRPGPLRTLRGTVRGRPGCRVAGALLSDGLHLTVRLEDGRRCWMAPLPKPLAAAHTYAVYDQRHLLPTGGECGMPGAADPDGADHRAFPGDVSQAGPVLVAQIACDTDTEFVAAHGSVAAAEARINAIVNAVNLQYESQVGIRLEITTIVIRTASDPYTAPGAQNRLCQFIEEWTFNRTDIDRDVAHLFTGARLRGNTIGIAADIGGTGICEREGGCRGGRFGTFGSYCLARSEFSSSFSCVTDLTAHELGHLWGAFHCACPASTMNAAITCANTFSAGAIRSIRRYRDTRDCLAEDQSVAAALTD